MGYYSKGVWQEGERPTVQASGQSLGSIASTGSILNPGGPNSGAKPSPTSPTLGYSGGIGSGAQAQPYSSAQGSGLASGTYSAPSAYGGFDSASRPPNISNYQQQGTPAATGASITRPSGTSGSYSGASNPYGTGMSGNVNPFDPKAPISGPVNDLTSPTYDEQAFLHTQNRLLEDPFGGMQQDFAKQAGQASAGENYLNQNLGSLQGPGQGEQYWSQVQGQYMDPFAGEQFARQATQNMSPQGPASAFYDQAMQQYDQFTGYSGPQNAQGQYGASQQQLQNGTQGQQNMAQIAGQYGEIGQYQGPNLASGQYGQTQQAFGDMPIANFDPFYDRARQLGVQAYNQDAAGRGVYGSSEALSGVGNVITDIEAQRANRSFDAEMQRAQEQRMRQQLLGEQARMGDLSEQGAFAANLKGAETFGNLNNQMGQLQNETASVLGTLANNADSQAVRAQEANIAGLNAMSSAASNADTAETDRYRASTTAMNNADRTALDRMNSGADIAFRGDDAARADYTAEAGAAASAAGAQNNRLQTASQIASTGSRDDLARLDSFNQTAGQATASNLARQAMEMDAVRSLSKDAQQVLSNSLPALFAGGQADFENRFNAELAPYLEEQGYSQQQINEIRDSLSAAANVYGAVKDDSKDEKK